MKLNNKGWSLNTLLICIAIFCIALLLSVFYVYRLGTQLKKSLSLTEQPNIKQNETNPNAYKIDLENISNATTEYLTTENKENQENKTIINNELNIFNLFLSLDMLSCIIITYYAIKIIKYKDI